jgi:hypothetical protein
LPVVILPVVIGVLVSVFLMNFESLSLAKIGLAVTILLVAAAVAGGSHEKGPDKKDKQIPEVLLGPAGDEMARQMAPHVWIGNARSLSMAKASGFGAVLVVADELLAAAKDVEGLNYHRVPIKDFDRHPVHPEVVREIGDWLDAQVAGGRETLIVCRAAMHRSASAALIHLYRNHPEKSYAALEADLRTRNVLFAPLTGLKDALETVYPDSSRPPSQVIRIPRVVAEATTANGVIFAELATVGDLFRHVPLVSIANTMTAFKQVLNTDTGRLGAGACIAVNGQVVARGSDPTDSWKDTPLPPGAVIDIDLETILSARRSVSATTWSIPLILALVSILTGTDFRAVILRSDRPVPGGRAQRAAA